MLLTQLAGVGMWTWVTTSGSCIRKIMGWRLVYENVVGASKYNSGS